METVMSSHQLFMVTEKMNDICVKYTQDMQLNYTGH